MTVTMTSSTSPRFYSSHTRSTLSFLSLGLGLALGLSHCVSYETSKLVPELTLSAENIAVVDEGTPPAASDFGIDVTSNESDSLFNLETLPGVRVRAVDTGGAAEASGIRAGDIILRIDGTPIDAPDALTLFERSATPRAFEFEIRRDTTVLAARVTARSAGNSDAPRELYRVDPLATRAGYRSERVEISGPAARSVAAARVVELFPGSPLPAANIKIGDVIIALQGRELSSAQDLISRLVREHALGERVTIDLFDGNTVRRESVQLWHPGRKISRVSIGPIAQYSASVQADSRQFTLIDLWLFSLYNYTQTGGERVHSLLGLFEFASDYGELVEEPQP